MSIKLTQKRFFVKREAEIMETKVVYMSTQYGRESQISIPYEDLSRHKEAYVLSRQSLLIAVGVLGLFTFSTFMWRNDKEFDNPGMWIFWGVLFLISIVLYLGSIEQLWKVRVQYNSYLFFFKNKPNKRDVDDFINTLFTTRDKYLKETYFLEASKNLSYESQKNNLQWLRKNEVIDASEFQDGKRKLDEVFNQDLNKIGFNKTLPNTH